ncbi:MAG TPA: zf-HC2 domain-containing protein, partial [Bryobacteraceae bacterium]|nr:zf-HC2 domain-containing protein [Bryobacteraceae bacterium]
MKLMQFGDSSCARIRRYLDSYINNELLVETNHEVLRHLETCPACAADVETRTRIKARLKSAVQN